MARSLLTALCAASILVSPGPAPADECCGNTTAPILKVMSLNLAHARGQSVNQMLVSKSSHYRNLDAVADLFRSTEPHVVALQEADAPSLWSGRFDHVDYLAQAALYPYYVHGVHANNWLHRFGTALLSRLELEAAQAFNFKPTPPTTTKGFVTAKINWPSASGSREVTVISLHLDFSRKQVRKVQTDEIAAFGDTLAGPIIVAGDMNGEWRDAGSALRLLADALDLQAYEPLAEKMGTYKAADGKRLDWILISPELEFVSHEILTDEVSDHFAVLAGIRFVAGEQ